MRLQLPDCWQTAQYNPSTVFTAIIAFATVAYVICTVLLWLATKKAANAAAVSADAAKQSADATKQAAEDGKRSADLLGALNRPYMGVHRVAFKNGPNDQNLLVWQITWEIRNFGTLPALEVKAMVEFCLGETIIFAWEGPRSAEIFPQSDPVATITNLQIEGAHRGEVMDGSVSLIARIRISYRASNGQRFDHRADARFNVGYGTFSVIKSETQVL